MNVRKRLFVKLSVMVLLLALSLAGCSAAQKHASESVAPSPSAPAFNNAAIAFSDGAFMKVETQGLAIERKVIMTARLEITTTDLPSIEQKVLQVVSDYGGHVQRSFFNNREGNQYWEFTLRIPTDSFDNSILDISALGTVMSSSTNGQDVTEEYLDLDARLRVLQQEEARLLELLSKAANIDDYLKVESHLSRVRIEIEQATGRLKYLNNRIDLATIELSIKPTQGTVEPELKGFAGLARQIKVAFRQGINGVVALISGMLVFIATLLPFAVVIVPLLGLVIVLLRRLRNNRKPPSM